MEVDAGLVGRACAGDSLAFEQLLEPLMEPGHRLACGILQDSYLAEDAVQDAAVNAWKNLAKLRQGAQLKPWFLAIVANQCHDQRRTRWWRRERLVEAVSSLPGPDEVAISRGELRRALQRLGDGDRLVVLLRSYLGLTWSEVAAASGLSEAGARTRYYRALERIRPARTREGTTP